LRRIEEILEQITGYHPLADLSMIQRAYVFSAQAHQGQVRNNGEPYLSHPLEVAGLLSGWKLDVPTVCSGLLHDTVEDNPNVTIETISRLFGPEVANIVDGVTKIRKTEGGPKDDLPSQGARQARNLGKMIVAMATDIRVLMVKLADRLHNMRTLGFLDEEKQKRIAQETIDIYAPLASRLGMQKAKSELEDLSLFYLDSEIYQEIVAGIASRRGEREKYIREVIDLISAKMRGFSIPCEVDGRSKHIYSIYRKMLEQNLTVDQLHDITAFRLVLDSVKDCYGALGIIHSMFTPIPGRFKDYISLPKANGYQSLHTSVIGPQGQRMEVQIRTREMHQYAEYGIAAHWRYKEGDKLTEHETNRFAWLRSLLEWQQQFKDDPTEFLASVKDGLTPEDVYVFTPAGDVRELRAGATPVDFAYAIHTEIGHRCIGAKVNGVIVPLKYKLKSGDTVEILTSKHGGPSKDWLNFVITPKARNRIRQWFNVEERVRAVSLGREILEREFRRENILLKQVSSKDGELERVVREFSLVSLEDLFASVGLGKISPRQVLGKLRPQAEKTPSLMDRMVRRIKKRPKTGIKVKGVDDILVRFAGCCNPLPGEEIVGYITQGRGVTVHAARCRNVALADPERRIDVDWQMEEGMTYAVRIQVISKDRQGGLAELSGAIAGAKANITQASVEVTPDNKGITEFTIQVTDRDHLRQVFHELKRIKWVERVIRLGGSRHV